MRFHRLILLVAFISLSFVACKKGPGARAPWTAVDANQGILGGVSGGVPITPPVLPPAPPSSPTVEPKPARVMININDVTCDESSYYVDLSWLTTAVNVTAVELRVDVVSTVRSEDLFYTEEPDLDNPDVIYNVEKPYFEGNGVVKVASDNTAPITDDYVYARAVIDSDGKKVSSNDASSVIRIKCASHVTLTSPSPSMPARR